MPINLSEIGSKIEWKPRYKLFLDLSHIISSACLEVKSKIHLMGPDGSKKWVKEIVIKLFMQFYCYLR